jgi:serine/threonine-protein kinase ATR
MKSNVSEVLLLAAECLGILGAIDPSRIDLDKPIISKEENCERFLNSNDKNFKIVLITLLMKAITTSAKTSDQNCSSFALQEIIKYFTSPQVINRIDINRDLNQELRDYCNVLLKSKYNNPIPFRSSQETTEVIFGSNPDLKYNQWLNEWLKTLFNSFIFLEEDSNEDQTNRNSILSQSMPSQLSGEFNSALEEVLTQNQIPIDILRVCFHAIIRNQSIAQFLLPYVVIASLRSANLEQKKLIVNEVKTIITKLTTEEMKFSEDIIHLSSQTVFHLYDHLKVWFKNRNSLHKSIGKTPRYLKTAQMRDREFKGVKYFLENISGLELATLAFNCNAFSRSLRYLEEYVKENDLKTGANSNTFQEKISFFQKIFVRLDEPDSVEGCNSKRTKTPTFDETILTHESMGQIQEALTCCAKAVQLFPNDFKYQEKYLQTLMQSFDQSDMVYTYGSGLMLRQPEFKAKIAPFVIEAVWKLGNWDELQNQLECHQNESFTTFGSGIGELFSSIINKQTISDFEDKLRFVRHQLVGPLSAAAMEISGYVRGHQYIVNLHILNDIQTAYNKLITKLTDECCDIDKFQNKFLKVVNIWEERNNMVRKTSRCQEPILNVQRAIFSLMDRECDFLSPFIKKQLFKSWLKSTKTSRKSGNIQRSYNCTLEMNKSRQSLSIYSGDGIIPVTITELTDSENSEAISEVAKVHWARNDKLGINSYNLVRNRIVIVLYFYQKLR